MLRGISVLAIRIEGKIKVAKAANKSCSKKRPEEVLFGLRFIVERATLFGVKA